MADLIDINNGDTGLQARDKINNSFAAVNANTAGLANKEQPINTMLDNVTYLSNQIAYDTPLFVQEANPLIPAVKDSATQIVDGVFIGDEDYTKYTLQGAEPSWVYEAAGFKRYLTPQGQRTPPLVRSFLYDGQKIEIRLRDVSGQVSVLVDGFFVDGFQVGATNGHAYYLYDLGDPKLRRIEIISQNEYWGGLVIEPDTSCIATDSINKVVAVEGDSFTEGTGAQFSQSYCMTIGAVLKNINLFAFGFGGSGYVNDSSGGGKFIDRLDEISSVNPDEVIVFGGHNDLSGDYSEFTAAVDAYYTELLTRFDVSQIVIGGIWYLQDPTAVVIQFNDYLRDKAAEIGARFIDPVGEAWVYGTGKNNARTGFGNADVYRGDDGTHPTASCHPFLGRKVATALMNTIRPI